MTRYESMQPRFKDIFTDLVLLILHKIQHRQCFLSFLHFFDHLRKLGVRLTPPGASYYSQLNINNSFPPRRKSPVRQ